MREQEPSLPRVSLPWMGEDLQDIKPKYIVGVGASAGGLEALERFFSKVPLESGLAFVVVQHLSPDFKSLMEELLARWTTLPIHRVEDGMAVKPDAVYLIPPKKDMIISDGKLLLTDRDPTQVPGLPINRFFRSLASDVGDRAVGVILSGTGSDGSQGVRYIREAGGLVIVQAVETAKFDGMPKSALETGAVDLELPPEEIPAALTRYMSGATRDEFVTAEFDPSRDRGWDAVFRLLRDCHAVDFSLYRSGTIARRTERRMMLNEIGDLDGYVQRLRDDPDELNVLYQDLLIGVTRFFRDPDAFQALESQVIPALFDRLEPGGELRVWVAGCATGEEAYSLGILFLEQWERRRVPVAVKIFATDTHKGSLEAASHGLYDEGRLAGVSQARRARFFVRRGDHYQVAPELRKIVVFAHHNLLKDAPFTKLDLITCRNLLIYLKPMAQKKVLSLFHFALKTGAFLFLGPSEGTGELSDEFDVLDARWKIFAKRRNVRLTTDFRIPATGGLTMVRPSFAPQVGLADGQLIGVYDTLLEQYMPPAVLINEHRELVQTFGGGGKYLTIRDGRHSQDILDMLDGDLRMALSGALQRAAKELKSVSYKALRLKTGDVEALVNVTVQPVGNRRNGAVYQLVTFEEIASPAPPTVPSEVDLQQASQDRLVSLETELRFTKENLQATIEELETSNEELQATNEELVASNEELQSTNEELHSVNEELYTVNAEYQRKIAELVEMTTDMDNLLVSTQVHTLFLDQDLCIRKFTPLMQTVFNLLPQDVSRRIDTFTHAINHPSLFDDIQRVLREGEPFEHQVQDRFGRWYLLRVLPYRSNSRVLGVVITLVDIGHLKQVESEARRSDLQLMSILENTPNIVYLRDLQGRFVLANEALRQVLGTDPVGKTSHDLLPKPFADMLARQARQVIETAQASQEEVIIPHADGPHNYLAIKFPIRDETGQLTGIGCIGTDVTALKKAEQEAKHAVAQRDQFLAMLSHELRNPLAAILGSVRLVRRGPEALPPQDHRLAVIERRAEHMSHLLDDLLDVARLAQNKIEIHRRRIDLRDTLSDVEEEVRALFDERRIDLSLETAADLPLTIDGDPARLQQVQVNLLVNAAKFTPAGGRVSLRLERDGAMAVIRVRDNGVGIEPHMVDRIFDLFVQAATPVDAAVQGIGVGLTLVKTIVDLHGGTITAHSDGPGRGTEFVVRLPLSDEPAPAPSAPPSAPLTAAPGARKILIVDDDLDNRMLMRAALELDGHTVQVAADAAEALRQLEQFQPAVAILDIGLPGTNGYQLARLIRQRIEGKRVLLIALTGFGRPEDRERATAAGFDAHLVKPLKPEELDRVIASTQVDCR